MKLLNNRFSKLNNKSALALLAYFCEHPSSTFYVREAAQKTGLSAATCNTALKLLLREGFLNAKRVGNQLHYSLKSDNAEVRLFRVFLNALALQPLVDSLKEYSERIVLYGSRAIGEESEKSDYDLFILSSQEEKVKGVLSANKKLENLSAMVADANRLVALKTREPAFYNKINSGITLWRKTS